jgi:GTP cyclohydrolase I
MTQGDFDLPRIERAVKEILVAIGEDPDRDGLRDTPARVARACAEQFAGLRQRPDDVLTTVFDADEHLCMTMRGVRKPGARTVTSAVRGAFRDNNVTRAEAMSIIYGRH